jgi:hypothetical protein
VLSGCEPFGDQSNCAIQFPVFQTLPEDFNPGWISYRPVGQSGSPMFERIVRASLLQHLGNSVNGGLLLRLAANPLPPGPHAIQALGGGVTLAHGGAVSALFIIVNLGDQATWLSSARSSGSGSSIPAAAACASMQRS